MASCVMWHILMVAVGNANALRKHHSQESGHALMHGAQLKQQAFTSRSANSSITSNNGWHGGAHCLTKAAAKTRQHSRRFRRLDNISRRFDNISDNISRRFGNLFLFPVKLKMSSTRQKCRVDDISRNLLDSTTFPFWREI